MTLKNCNLFFSRWQSVLLGIVLALGLSGCSVIEWSRVLGTPQSDEGFGIAVASDGSVYVTGITEGNLGGLTNKFARNYFLAKYDSAGKPAWVRLVDASPYAPLNFLMPERNAVAVAANGDVYVVGRTKIGLPGLSGIGSQDGFIVCYSSSGTVKWSQLLGSAKAHISAYGVFVHPKKGTIYITGVTNGSVIYPAPPAGNYSAFLMRIYPDGSAPTLLGVHVPTKEGVSIGYDIALVGYKDVILAGGTNTSVSPQKTTPAKEAGGFSYTDTGHSDIFLSRWHESGSSAQATVTQLGSAGYDRAYSVASHISANKSQVYVAGDVGTFTTPKHTPGVVLLKMQYSEYQGYGTSDWTKYIPSGLGHRLAAVTTDSAGDIYFMGSTDKSVHGEANNGGADAFLAVYRPNGDRRYSYLLGTPANDFGNNIAVDAKGYIYIVGTTFGTAPYHFPTNAGNGDVFLMRIKPPSKFFTVN